MPIVSALAYVASKLQGMTPPGATGIRAPVSALITPLDPDVMADGIARAYVWPAKGPEKRLAMPRNTGPGTRAGWKTLTHSVQIFLVWMDSNTDPGIDVNFPLLIDWVMHLLRTSAPNPQMWTDPYTGKVSQMLNLGEVMSYDYVPPHTTAEQGWFRFDARITCSLTEQFQD